MITSIIQNSRPEINRSLAESLNKLEPVGLSDIQHAALLKRVESKYLFNSSDLPVILDRLQADYAVLEIEGYRLNRYRTLYFDTPDFLMYRQHHANRLDRFKVRTRRYIETGSSFLEVKPQNKPEADDQRSCSDR